MMKRFFYFFALSAIVIGMASCDGNDPANKKFQITGTLDNYHHAIDVTVTPVNQNKYYHFGCMKSSIFLQRPVVYVNSELSNLNQGNYPEGLCSGTEGKSCKNLLEGTEYAIYACEVDENYQIVGNIEYILVRTEGPLQGRFSVNSSGKQVRFAPGNLQRNTEKTNLYRFPAKQWEFTANDGNGWDDLLSLETARVSHIVSNGGSQPWRTMTYDEWDYMLYKRTNYTNLRGNATVNGIHGLVLLPDNWSAPSSPKFIANTKNWTTNQYSAENWAILEDAGAVFLPAAEWSGVSEVGTYGTYWTSTCKYYYSDGSQIESYMSVYIYEEHITLSGSSYKDAANFIRCVQDVQ